MKTLIVPCAGGSSRFPNMRPKWMLYYPDGKLMVEKALEGLDLKEYDQVIFTIVRDHVEKFQAAQILEDIFHFSVSKVFKLCILEDFTSCQAETVYLTLLYNNVTGSFVVKDSDNYICVSMKNKLDCVAGINIETCGKEIARLSAKSFLILNNQGIITDIIEKQIKSEYISVGMYGFRDVELFKDAYLHLKDVSDKKYEIYLSHIIAYLIGTKKSVYTYLEATDYEDWGTLEDWNIVLRKKRTIIINIDGLLFEKNGRYGANNWSQSLKPNESNMKKLREQSEMGAQIILLTSMSEDYINSIEELLKVYGVQVYKIISGCFLSQELLISKKDDAIPYPACDSINIIDNTELKDYL